MAEGAWRTDVEHMLYITRIDSKQTLKAGHNSDHDLLPSVLFECERFLFAAAFGWPDRARVWSRDDSTSSSVVNALPCCDF